MPFMQQGQAQKHVTHNEALEILDLLVQLTVEAFDAEAPPADPAEGQIWALGPAPAEGWAGHAGDLAAWANGGWLFLQPKAGWRAALGDDVRVWTGAGWERPRLPELVDLAGVGVNAGYDAENRLAVSAPAALFTHDGSDHRLKINKAAPADTATLLFQTDWSGRAEMGLAGEDDFSFKVSPDGSTWHEGIRIDRNTGRAHVSGMRERLYAHRTYHVRTDGDDANSGLADDASGAFRTISRALDVVYGTLDLGRFDVTIAVAPGIYEEFIEVLAPSIGAGLVTVRGTGAQPDDVIIRGTSGVAPAYAPFGVLRAWNGAVIALDNLRIERESGPSVALLDIRSGANVIVDLGDTLHLGATNNSAIRIVGGTLTAEQATLRLVGNVSSLLLVRQGGSASIVSATVDVDGRSFSNAVFVADRCGVIAGHTGATTITGTATGARVQVRSNGVIDFGNKALSTLPGSSNGVVDSGGVYIPL